MSIPLPRTTKPRPTTIEATLFCEKEKTFTRHTFSHSAEVSGESGHRQATKFIYTCPCGEHRVWGSED